MFNIFKKYFQAIFVLAFITIFSLYLGGEYLDFYKQNTAYQKKILDTKSLLNDFSLDKIKSFTGVSLEYAPDISLLEKIRLKIENANSRVYLNTYIFTEKRIIGEIIKAKKRWLDVKVILEKNPYKAYNINNKTYSLLEKNGISVSWSNPKFFTFDHAKYFIIDDEFIISTWNVSYSTFTRNRDFFVFVKNNEDILETILEIFNSDFIYKRDSFYNDYLVVSPEYSRYKLKKMVEESKVSLKMYFQYLYDKDFISLFEEKAKILSSIEIIVRQNFYDESKDIVEKLESSWIKLYPMSIPLNHSKAILVDSKYLFIWSINMSETSLNKNRELWIILNDEEITKKFENVFSEDMKKIQIK